MSAFKFLTPKMGVEYVCIVSSENRIFFLQLHTQYQSIKNRNPTKKLKVTSALKYKNCLEKIIRDNKFIAAPG